MDNFRTTISSFPPLDVDELKAVRHPAPDLGRLQQLKSRGWSQNTKKAEFAVACLESRCTLRPPDAYSMGAVPL